MENQKAKHQNRKKTGSKINGKKKERQKEGKRGKKWTWPFDTICIFVAFFCFFDLLFFCFYFAFFCFFWLFAWKKAKKKQNKSKKKQIKKAKKKQQKCKWTSPFFPIFPPFCLSFLFSCFFPFILLLCFLDFADLLFGFSILFAFFALFFKFLKNKNKLWFGEHNHNLNVSHSTRFLLVLSNSQVSPKFKESMFEFLSPTKYRFDAWSPSFWMTFVMRCIL